MDMDHMGLGNVPVCFCAFCAFCAFFEDAVLGAVQGKWVPATLPLLFEWRRGKFVYYIDDQCTIIAFVESPWSAMC